MCYRKSLLHFKKKIKFMNLKTNTATNNNNFNLYYITAIFLCLLKVPILSNCQNIIKIRLYSENTINSTIITINTGCYAIISSSDTILNKLQSGTIICLSIKNDKIELKKNDSIIGYYKNLNFAGLSFRNSLSILPDKKKTLQRTYDDCFNISANKTGLMIINNIDLEDYIAGVVQSEAGGSSDNEEFFKIQAVISRTYAVGHLNNHKAEGYNLCDAVHCQSYKGQATKTVLIKAVYATRGSVIADNENKLITAAYHSNSGGKTVNSGDLWNKQLPYLIAVDDTFSLHGPNSLWEIKMKTKEWLDFLKINFDYPIHDSISKNYALNFSQDTCRLIFFEKDIKLRTIREKLKLRSTWFSVFVNEDEIIIKGRGYGHGVGLSQEGAAIMAEKGFSFTDILNFYYKGVQIIKKEKLFSDN